MRVIMNTNSEYFKSESGDYYTDKDSDCSSVQGEVRPKLYWTQKKRDIIYQIFQEEMNNRSLLIPQRKIKMAIRVLKEEEGSKSEARIRTLVHRLRNELTGNKDSGDRSSRAWYWTEERRQIIKTTLSDEINDNMVPLTRSKIRQVLVQLKEKTILKNKLRVRNFIYRLRAEERIKSRELASANQSEEKRKCAVVDAEVYEHYLQCPLVNKKSWS